jgi:hypothetical protein
MDDEWINANQAFELVRKSNPHSAATTICARAHDGLIATKARLIRFGDHRREDAEVPSEFWWARGEAALTQNWQSGDFETWIDQNLHCRAYGVLFLRQDIVALVPEGTLSLTKSTEQPRGNFASAARCVGELVKQLSCTPKEAGDQIVRFCAAGLIDSRCTSFWLEVTDLFGAKEEQAENLSIPSWFWENCLSDQDAILDWRTGTFAGRGKVGLKVHKARVRGAVFDISGVVDLEIMLRGRASGDSGAIEDTPITARSTDTAGRGGRPKSDNWANWIAELATYVHEEGIPSGTAAEGQDAVIGAIEERLAAKGHDSLGRSTVQAVVRAVLIRLRSAGN